MYAKDLLAAELRKAHLPELAIKAEAGMYDELRSPLALPEMVLMQDLTGACTDAASELYWRCIAGEFAPTDDDLDDVAARSLIGVAVLTTRSVPRPLR